MEKMKMQTVDGIARNIEKLEELFPNCVTETRGEDGAIKKAINFDVLRQLLSGEIAESPEAYDFTWVGKKDALAEAHKPIRKTLRPCPEESRNWDSTQNIYIEGDNLEVLKLLQESYLGKVKMIYIDPPYNTGSDSFVYNDNFRVNDEEYDEEAWLFDEEGNKVFRENNASNPRFHSDWCSMIYSRLILARTLLSDDGVIFISIDEREIENLKKICNEVMGSSNYVQEIVWNKKFSPQNDAKYFSLNHESVLCYAKNKPLFHRNLLPMTEEMRDRYKNIDNDPRGPWTSGDCTVGRITEKDYYPIITPSGKEVYPSAGNAWRFSRETFKKLIEENRIWFGKDGNNMPRVKRFLSETNQGLVPISVWNYDEVGHTQSATQALKVLFGGKDVFDYSKPCELIKRMLIIACEDSSIVLDFFSGSATTAHAVMQLNAERLANDAKGALRYILVQLPEVCDEKSEAYKSGYKNICEIGKERIRRAGDKIKSENPLTTAGLDVGFRVFKVDESNMKDVYYGCDDLTQDLLESTESNIKPDRTDLDLLFSCVLEWGLPLSMPYKTEQIDGFTVHTYNDGDLIACFQEGVTEKLIIEIARRNPLRAVFRDSCFSDVASKINLWEIFKRFAPDSKIKTL